MSEAIAVKKTHKRLRKLSALLSRRPVKAFAALVGLALFVTTIVAGLMDHLGIAIVALATLIMMVFAVILRSQRQHNRHLKAMRTEITQVLSGTLARESERSAAEHRRLLAAIELSRLEASDQARQDQRPR